MVLDRYIVEMLIISQIMLIKVKPHTFMSKACRYF